MSASVTSVTPVAPARPRSPRFRTFAEGHMIAFVLDILMTRMQPDPAPPAGNPQ